MEGEPSEEWKVSSDLSNNILQLKSNEMETYWRHYQFELCFHILLVNSRWHFPEQQMETSRCGVCKAVWFYSHTRLSSIFQYFTTQAFSTLKRQCVFYLLFIASRYAKKIYIALLEGCQTSPTCPDKNSIRIKISMGSDGVILRDENRNWPAPVPICPQQFPLELALDWSRDSAVRSERLTAESRHVLEELRLYKQYLYIHLLYRTEITGYPLQNQLLNSSYGQ